MYFSSTFSGIPFSPEPIFKANKMGERVDPMSHRFFTIFMKHSFGGLGADTLTFCGSTPFFGEVGGRGAFGFTMAELRFPSFCNAAGVRYDKLVLQLCKRVGSNLLIQGKSRLTKRLTRQVLRGFFI